VGVVRNVRNGGENHEAAPQFYCPVWQLPTYATFVSIVVGFAGPTGPNFEPAVHRAAFSVDPRMVISQVSALEDQARSSVFFQKSAFTLLGTLSTLAAALAALGLFAVMAYAVAQRSREFGIRMALGATPGDLQWFVLRRGLFVAAAGILLGLGASWALVRLLQRALFETSPHDPLTYAVVASGLLALAALACWLPARRASKVDPVVALRSE
jgi:ABC-type antimicrobial peptide transport system permease subunit